MPIAKRSISFDPEVLEGAEEVARRAPYGGNLSGFVNDAVSRRLKLMALAGFVAEHEREAGDITAAERAAIDREWPA
jgi:hypothetical protein